jgi:hypothetical protein
MHALGAVKSKTMKSPVMSRAFLSFRKGLGLLLKLAARACIVRIV